jgi:hypothetical protein
MKRKGYSSIEDFRGKLKPRDKDTKVAKSQAEVGSGQATGLVEISSMHALVGLLLAIIAGLLAYISKRDCFK